MPMQNLIEYSDNFLKTSRSLWQYYRDEPFIDNDGYIIDVPEDPNTASFKYKEKITGHTRDDLRKDFKK